MPVYRFTQHALAAAVLTCSISLPAISHALTLAEAEQRALSHSPALSAAEASAQAAAGDARQAGLLPNPELGYSRENLGNDKLTGLDGPTSTWQLSQRLEFGRSARKESAGGLAEAESLRAAQERRLLLADVRSSWVEVLASQQRLAFAQQLSQLTVQMRDAVSTQVRAGKTSPVELKRIEVAMASVQRREQQAKVTLLAARQKLAGLQGLRRPDFGELPHEQFDRQPLIPLPSEAIDQSTAAQIVRAETRASEASLRAAKAGRLPSLTVSLGQSRYEDTNGEKSWQMGIGLPLPLFNRNQGATQAAEARMREAQSREQAALQSFQTELEVAYAAAATLDEQLTNFEKSVLPASEDAFQAVSKGYGYGKFGLLDVLDAQRALIDTRFEYLDTLTQYHSQRNRLDALIGKAEENTK